MRINTNMMALNAQNKLTVNQGNVEKAIQKLSSGLRINGAADDAAFPLSSASAELFLPCALTRG